MAPQITRIDKGSPAHTYGICPGDRLVSIDGHIIRDVLDYKFYGYDSKVKLVLERDGQQMELVIEKAEGEDLGLDFETYLMDRQKGCANKCVFCFIDQLPRGMRQSLYFKDDDARLSFLMGNYITLTNLSDADVQRIIQMRLSPLNVSVHTTDPELRKLMLGNLRGGESLRHLYTLAEAGIKLKTQIVCCPGLNDGAQLEKTLADLSGLYPSVESIAVVPVGITAHREGLYPLTPMDKEKALAVVDIVEAQRKENLKKYGCAIVCGADELYLKAGLTLPEPEYYEGYSQLENGVGLMALFEEELRAALLVEEENLPAPSPCAVVCGKAAEAFMQRMVDLIRVKCPELDCPVFGVDNDFFGRTVDVTGLVTGRDIGAQLQDKVQGRRLLVPAVMLRDGQDVFLDDTTPAQLEKVLGAKLIKTEIDGGIFLDTVMEYTETF